MEVVLARLPAPILSVSYGDLMMGDMMGDHLMGGHDNGTMAQGVSAALECHRICEETINYCLQQGGRHAEAAHIRLLTDCADICRMAADFMARSSEFHPAICGICADVCRQCAAACEAFGDDVQMQRCADACRECERSCRQMAAAHA